MGVLVTCPDARATVAVFGRAVADASLTSSVVAHVAVGVTARRDVALSDGREGRPRPAGTPLALRLHVDGGGHLTSPTRRAMVVSSLIRPSLYAGPVRRALPSPA